MFKWIRLGDIGLCSVTDTGCQEDQQLPHTHYWGGREGGGRFLSSSTPLCIRVSHSALTKDLGTPQLLLKKLLRQDFVVCHHRGVLTIELITFVTIIANQS